MTKDDDRPWHHETTKILEEIGCLKLAEARHYLKLDGRITDLQNDLKIHKVKTGFVAGITTTGLIVSAWIVSMIKGGG